MAKKVYAVRKGNTTGLFYSWGDCQNATRGYSGVEFKGFNDENEALAYLRGEEIGLDTSTGNKVNINKPDNDYTVNIYTDGSFKDNFISLGLCIESKDRIHKFYGVVDCKQYASIANIAGELLAVLVGVQVAKDMGYSKMNILYDYAGVEAWYSGSWRAKGELQVIYSSLLNQLRISNDLSFNFIKVTGHSNVQGNIIADKMAKRARNFMDYINIDLILQGKLTVRDVPLF